MDHQQEEREHIHFEVADDDSLEGFTCNENVQRQRRRRELHGNELVVALDGTGDQSGEVQRVVQIRNEADIAMQSGMRRARVNDQMKDAKKDV